MNKPIKPFSAALTEVPGGFRLSLGGAMRDDVSAKLAAVAKRLDAAPRSASLLVDVAALQVVNSHGIGLWTRFASTLALTLTFENCSSYFVEYVNVFPEILGRGCIASFAVPYRCPACLASVDVAFRSVEVDRVAGLPPTRPCPSCCKDTMEIEVDPLDFLTFLDQKSG